MALDIVLAVFIVLDVILLTKEKDYKSNGLYILKFLMTLSITLTCLVYMIILGPTSENGLIGAYLNKYAGSLGVHLIGPVFAIADFLMFDKGFFGKENICNICSYSTTLLCCIRIHTGTHLE